MKISELIDYNKGADDPEITGITSDSRKVRPGFLFAALPGTHFDGRTFIAQALDNGARAVLAPSGTTLPADYDGQAVLAEADNPRRALALAAARFYKTQPRFIAAVTGTNGKTSVADFTCQLWQACGVKAASLGTLGLRGAGAAGDQKAVQGASMTTPDPVALHETLSALAQGGTDHLALEASSHGLDQSRLDGVKVSAAAFTNLSRDHLDYHHDMAAYLAAKARLFSDILQEGGTAVLNADVPEYAPLRDIAVQRGLRVLSYGQSAGADLQLLKRTPQPDGQALSLRLCGQDYQIMLPLVGAFQAMNALCALGLVLAEGTYDLAVLAGALEGLSGVPGRLQLVPGHPAGGIYIDYAHTPDALENILGALRPHTKGRLICLVGCGGDRDPGKRPLMGALAAQLSDLAVITDDNPRSEDPAAIRAAMMAGAAESLAKTADADVQEIGDRRAAIRHAVSVMVPGDVLVIAGKGHEQGQIIGDQILPFDDAAEARAAMAELNIQSMENFTEVTKEGLGS